MGSRACKTTDNRVRVSANSRAPKHHLIPGNNVTAFYWVYTSPFTVCVSDLVRNYNSCSVHNFLQGT